MSVIKAGTTVTTALVLEGDTDGDLIFKTGSAAVTAMSISASGVVSFPQTTSLALSGTVTLSTGTPNGMLYLNGSSVITSSSAVVFDGTNMGVGVTPSAWQSGRVAFQIQRASASGGVVIHTAAASQAIFGANNYFDGTNSKYIGNGHATNYQQLSGEHQWSTAPDGVAGNNITFTQAMTLDSSARLMVKGGTTAYGNITCQVNEDANNDVYIRNDSTGASSACGIVVNASGNSWRMGMGSTANNGNALTWVVDVSAPSEKMRLTTGGDLLVGTTSYGVSAAGFCVNGASGTAKGACISVLTASTNANTTYEVYSTNAGAYRFYVGMDGTVNATNTTISAISDQRLKENIRDLDVGLDAVLALKPRKFDWKEGKGQDKKDVRGFIAQEFEQIFPDLVDEWKDPAPEGEEPYKSVRQDLIPVLVKAIQELKAELDATKAEVAALKGAN